MAGAEFELAVDTSVDVVAAGEEPFAEIALVVEGAHGAGTAIYRAGRRVPIGYRLLDAEGRTLREGVFDYG
mgnify:CR=1 FL=1